MSAGFTKEQTSYLEGFAAGSNLSSMVQPSWGATVGAPAHPKPRGGGEAPLDPNRAAQDSALNAGKKLSAEETAKRKIGHGLDIWDDIVRHAASDKFPKGTDVFLFKFHGMFYVAPAQDAFMCRLRIPGGSMTAHQLAGLASLAEELGGGYADLTTRANLQVRQIRPKHVPEFLMGLSDLGIVSKGSGADNVRNVTCSPTSGIDSQELIDTLPIARRLHHHILHHRELYGLPRKFNIAFDGGGRVSSLEDTNDIGFTAARHSPTKQVFFRLALGGITGHLDFARDTTVVVKPADAVAVCHAILLAFIEHGDRTDRKKARLKYVLDRMGLDGFLKECEKHYGKPFDRLPAGEWEPRPPVAKHDHVGVHKQKQSGMNYIGVVLPVGRMTAAQMRGLADIATRFGSGTIRLTVWQNLLITDIPDRLLGEVKSALTDLSLHWLATSVRAGLVACTGAAGCKYASADTKRHALMIADELDSRIQLDQAVNIHLTGCPHSCAQHYIGDIGLLATKVGDDAREGYHLFVGGGYGVEQRMGVEVARNVLAEDTPRVIETLLRSYQAGRAESESFFSYVSRRTPEELKSLVPEGLVSA